MRSRSRTVLPALSVLSIAALLTAGCAGRETTTAIDQRRKGAVGVGRGRRRARGGRRRYAEWRRGAGLG